MEYTRTRKSGTGRSSPPIAMQPNIRTVKASVRIETVAADYGGEFRMVGNERLIGRCLSPNHEDQTPSMSIYTDDQRFKCFGCQHGGDVLDLVMLAEGCELHDALVSLANRYGIELPGRPDSWHRKQSRQQKIRDDIDREKIEHIRLLVFRLIFLPWLRRLPNWSREEATQSSWELSRSIALRLYEERRGA